MTLLRTPDSLGARAAELLGRFCASDDDARVAPSVALVLAHADDEVAGAGGRLARLPVATIIHVTDGAPRDMRDATVAGVATREDYARVRRAERAAALALAGIAPARVRDLGITDQEASLSLASLAGRVADLLSALRPEVVVTHPYEGGHPDHDATAFAVHAARRLLCRRGVPPPAIIEQTSYHNRDGTIAVFEFLPNAHDAAVRTVELSAEECALKRRMLDCYATQRRVLEAFPVRLERFRVAPRYDFTRAPHAGTLWYERFDWGMTGARWRELAAAALVALELGAA